MKYVMIYLTIGVINDIIGLWMIRKDLRNEKFNPLYLLGIVIGIIAWPITNILIIIDEYKNGRKA